MDLRNTNDGHMYEVCLEIDGIRECAFVSSMHLVEDKKQQLKAAIKRRALDAFVTHAANSDCDI